MLICFEHARDSQNGNEDVSLGLVGFEVFRQEGLQLRRTRFIRCFLDTLKNRSEQRYVLRGGSDRFKRFEAFQVEGGI